MSDESTGYARHPLDDVPTLENVLRRLAPESLAR